MSLSMFDSGLFVLIPIVYLIVIGFCIYLVYRFVKAHESVASSLEKIAELKHREFKDK